MRPKITLLITDKKLNRTTKISKTSSFSTPSLFEAASDTVISHSGFPVVIELSPKALKLSGAFRRVKTV